MYYRHVHGTPTPLLLLTKSDAEYCAAVLRERRPSYRYEARPHLMGYEGADYGVTCYGASDLMLNGRFIEWVAEDTLRELCRDRPIVPQSESWK